MREAQPIALDSHTAETGRPKARKQWLGPTAIVGLLVLPGMYGFVAILYETDMRADFDHVPIWAILSFAGWCGLVNGMVWRATKGPDWFRWGRMTWMYVFSFVLVPMVAWVLIPLLGLLLAAVWGALMLYYSIWVFPFGAFLLASLIGAALVTALVTLDPPEGS